MNKSHVVIVGGGISGLGTAYFLSRLAQDKKIALRITLLEANTRLGGVIRTLDHGSFISEAGPDALEAGDEVLSLCRDLGIEEDLVKANPCFQKFFILKDRKILPAPRPVATALPSIFFQKSCLSFAAKCRMFQEPWIPARRSDTDESAGDFFRRRLGESFLKEYIAPLMRGIYMAEPERISARIFFPQLIENERRFGSLCKALWAGWGRRESLFSKRFVTFKKGIESLPRALVRELGSCTLRLSSPVDCCAYDHGWQVTLKNGEKLSADAVCFAMTSAEAARLVRDAMPDLYPMLSAIQHGSIAAVNFIFKAPDVWSPKIDFGFMIPAVMGEYPFCSLKWLGRTPDGEHVSLRAFLSETMLPGFYAEEDAVLTGRILETLRELWGIRAQPLFISVDRYSRALPQYETGHLERLRSIETRLQKYPGLYFGGNSYDGFGITECIRRARKTAQDIFSCPRSPLAVGV